MSQIAYDNLEIQVNLSGYTMPGYLDHERVNLNGFYTSKTLSDLMIEYWIPYMECHKCGKSDYCKYALPHPYNSYKKQEIKCGVVETAIKNHIKATFELLQKLNHDQIQDYLDGAYYTAKFIQQAEVFIGNYLDEDIINYFGTYAPLAFGQVCKLRDGLNLLGHHLSKIPEFHVEKGVLLVEGESEKSFLEKMKRSSLYTFLNLITETYSGTGNRRTSRIEMLLDKYKKDGYKVFIQGDADGKNNNIFSDLISKGKIAEGNEFLFKYDFESAIPLKWLFYILKKQGDLSNICENEFLKKIEGYEGSVCKFLSDSYGLGINSQKKIKIAEDLAELMSSSEIWLQNEEFDETELGKFMKFIHKI